MANMSGAAHRRHPERCKPGLRFPQENRSSASSVQRAAEYPAAPVVYWVALGSSERDMSSAARAYMRAIRRAARACHAFGGLCGRSGGADQRYMALACRIRIARETPFAQSAIAHRVCVFQRETCHGSIAWISRWVLGLRYQKRVFDKLAQEQAGARRTSSSGSRA